MIPSAFCRTVAGGATDRFLIPSLPQGTHLRGLLCVAAPPDAAAAIDANIGLEVRALRSVSEFDGTNDNGEQLFRGEAAAGRITVPVRTQVYVPMDLIIGEYSLTAFAVTLVNGGAGSLDVTVSLDYKLPRRGSRGVPVDRGEVKV